MVTVVGPAPGAGLATVAVGGPTRVVDGDVEGPEVPEDGCEGMVFAAGGPEPEGCEPVFAAEGGDAGGCGFAGT